MTTFARSIRRQMGFKESMPVGVFERLLMQLRVKAYRRRTYRDLFLYAIFFFLFMILVFFVRDLRVSATRS